MLLLEFRDQNNGKSERIYFRRGRNLHWILEANPEIRKLLAGIQRFRCCSGLKTKLVRRDYRPKNCDVIYY